MFVLVTVVAVIVIAARGRNDITNGHRPSDLNDH